jgi:hypothetical protein
MIRVIAWIVIVALVVGTALAVALSQTHAMSG